ncbi:adenylate cyclase [Hydrogenivirga caldilitoris]|uniref:Adenylate cyclase n=1 Tax=Hydrogenivirga caldilitoris TaxID=246264 RepID=A0A497XS44_9AQUI|nr:adenylate/guanylate cyclase domain-containing protein [Hydrogenivirga caldilitoris]RLJ70919.1 adenylate cyclase [Hydrogenivirga caldilitoris]
MLYRLLAFFLVGGVLALIYVLKPALIERVSLRIEDTKFYVRKSLGQSPKPTDKVVVVAIDEKSVNKLGRWPWSRKVIAKLISELSVAKVTALDIVFSEPENEESDRELARSIAQAGNVVLGFFFRLNSTQKEDPYALNLLRESEFLRYTLKTKKVGLLDIPYVELSLPEFMSGALSAGYLNAEPDVDAIYRKYTLAHLFRGSVYLPLALQALRFYEGKDIHMELSEGGIDKLLFKGEEVPIYEGRFHRINFYDPDELKVVSAVDIIEGRVPREKIEGKAVFVGATEIGIYDVRPTPLDPVMPGVFLHAFAFSNFEEFHFIKQSPYLDLSIIYLMAGIPFLLITIRKFAHRFFFYTTLLVCYPTVSYGLFSLGSYDLNLSYPLLALILSLISQEGLKIITAERNIRELRKAFSSYVSPQLLEIITRNPDKLRLGGEKREITVLFSDIRGFTSLSENLKPEELVNLLNEFLTPMTDIILSQGGTLDKYIGDAIMAIFNAPVDVDRHADRACKSALEMVKALKGINHTFKETFGVTLDIGIGINTGEAVVGNMGSKQRFDYTAIGDTVNLASRLESLNKLYGTRIIISEYTKEKLVDNFLTRALDKVVVKGRREAVKIYELLEDTEENREKAERFEKALEQYFAGNFESAMLLFEEVSMRFGDKPSFVLLKRCREMIEKPPKNWKGIYVAREK